jgi:hypothetical protein
MCLHVQEIGQGPAFGELISATNDEVGRDTLPGHVDEIPELSMNPSGFSKASTGEMPMSSTPSRIALR